MDRQMSESLDRWITGNYGEDSIKGNYFCLECGECVDDLVAGGGPETELMCMECREKNDLEPDINNEKAHRDWVSRTHGGDDPREER